MAWAPKPQRCAFFAIFPKPHGSPPQGHFGSFQTGEPTPVHGSQAKQVLGRRPHVPLVFLPRKQGCRLPFLGEIFAMMDKLWPQLLGPWGEKKHLLQFCVKPPTSGLISAESGTNRDPGLSMTNKMTTSGGRALVPGARCPIPSPASASSALKPRRGRRRARSSEEPPGKGPASPPAPRAQIAAIKNHSSLQLVLNRSFQKPSQMVSLLCRALLKDVKISNHRKVNISKLAFQNPSRFQKSLEFHLSAPPPRPSRSPRARVFFINLEAVQVKPVFSSRVLRAGSSFVI